MGSRLKKNPERTFNLFFEATYPIARDKDPSVIFQFPEDFSDEESCQTLSRFCFPYDSQRVKERVAVQHFTFALTDIEGCQRFGFCRLTSSTQTCLCILSYLPWFEVFYKLLNNLADYLCKGQANELRVLLSALYEQPIPLAAGSVTLQMIPYFIAPDPRSLPSIPENRNLTELIVAVDAGNLLQLFASMLFERRILIFASKLSTLTACVHALSATLYPMYWQHIFIPVLPPHLLDYCCAPMPYLIGVHTSLLERVRSRGLEEAVILNVDTNTLENPFDDIKKIPSDVMSELKVCLKRHSVSAGCGVSRAFLRAQSLLFGGYRDALQGQMESEIWFSQELFLDHKSPSMRHFLQNAVQLQCFKQFIDDRLDVLNKGKEPDDLFEEEILKCETTGIGKSYHHLVGNLKKGGGALILNMKSKANVRAKGLARSGLKHLLMHKSNSDKHTLQRGGSVSHRRAQSDCLQNRLPITQHFGTSRPRRPGHKLGVTRDKDSVDAGDAWEGAVSGPVIADTELQKDEDEGEDSLLCDPEEMDLLGEIFDTLSTRNFHDRGLLYGTRSLDLFGPDSHDYITKFGPANPSQESLCLSISGSESLHSWNVETTEEVSDLTEDSDGLSLDVNAPDGEGTESLLAACNPEGGPREVGEKQDQLKVPVNGKTEDPESSGEGLEEKAEQQEDNRLREIRNDELNQRNSTAEGNHGEKIKTLQDLAGMREENMQVEGIETVESSTKLEKVNPLNDNHPSTVEKEQVQEETSTLNSASGSFRDQILAAASKPPPGHENTPEEVKRDEKDVTLSPPNVRFTVACFQAQMSNQSSQVKSRTSNSVEPERPHDTFHSGVNAQISCDLNIQSEAKSCSEVQEEEDPPIVKVSELKKRFEA
ncbi:DENN domain-containing protein 1B [Aulostomus maculatus]